MENTLENKAKFFAQYHGQKRVRRNGKLNLNPSELATEQDYLELKDILSITDDDLNQMGRILNDYISSSYKDDLRYCREVLKRFKNNNFRTVGAEVLDFLRSKGYAVPWMGLQVEKLQKYGWIKLKTQRKY